MAELKRDLPPVQPAVQHGIRASARGLLFGRRSPPADSRHKPLSLAP